jgi:hypothetical protein
MESKGASKVAIAEIQDKPPNFREVSKLPDIRQDISLLIFEANNTGYNVRMNPSRKSNVRFGKSDERA